jgi:NADH-quinone oxidoreductase subunit K
MNDSIMTSLLIFAGILFAFGFVGFLTRRSLILMFLSLEMMLAGVSINLITFAKHHGNFQGQIMSIMVLSIAACEAAIALALVVSLYRRKATLDVKEWDALSETIVPDEPELITKISQSEMHFPTLTPSGLDPMQSPVPAEFKAEVGEVQVPSEKKSEEVTHA